jgi:hypothetical protein
MALYSSYSGEGQIVRYSKGLKGENRTNSTLIIPDFNRNSIVLAQGAEYRIQSAMLQLVSDRQTPTSIHPRLTEAIKQAL